MNKKCTTHHHACDCREAKFLELASSLQIARTRAYKLYVDIAILKDTLNTVKSIANREGPEYETLYEIKEVLKELK